MAVWSGRWICVAVRAYIDMQLFAVGAASLSGRALPFRREEASCGVPDWSTPAYSVWDTGCRVRSGCGSQDLAQGYWPPIAPVDVSSVEMGLPWVFTRDCHGRCGLMVLACIFSSSLYTIGWLGVSMRLDARTCRCLLCPCKGIRGLLEPPLQCCSRTRREHRTIGLRDLACPF